MRVFALTFETDCEAKGCQAPATGLFGDLCLCSDHVREYQRKPMSPEDRDMWRKINNERLGLDYDE